MYALNCIKIATAIDPACGSGNFLTETYISLRRLENEALLAYTGGQMMLGGEGEFNPIKVGIGQFYGIEINDFAVTVAKTALWIAESQMMHETEQLMQVNLDFLPLKSYANIVEGNALRVDWESVVPKDKLNFIMGNPPFVGYKFQTKSQKDEISLIAGDFPNYGTLDYVSAWYIKSADFIKDTKIIVAFVATNSICQGEHVTTLWKPLFSKEITIKFAYRTFIWDSEASLKAHVHCVIVGFGCNQVFKEKWIYDSDRKILAQNISGYLLDTPSVFIDKQKKPLCSNVPIATKGNAAMDNGNLTLNSEEYENILQEEPYLVNLEHVDTKVKI